MKKYRIIGPIVIFLTLLLGACSGDETRNWTIMVYMDADNNLDFAAPLDVQEMLDIGSSENVTVIVQFDSRSTPTRRYRIDRGQLTLLKDLGEQNMASSDTLRDFIVAGMEEYPAEHFALIIWDHGYGWESGIDKRVASLLQDWNNTNVKTAPLPNYVVAQGINGATDRTGIKLDILGIDACLMASIEAVYEFRNSAAIMVASQDIVQGLGWDYRDLLGRLTENPIISPTELAALMVESYRQQVEAPSHTAVYGSGDQTIVALMLGSGIETLAQEVDRLARRLMTSLDDPVTRTDTVLRILTARAAAQQLQPPTYVDLVDFSRLLEPEKTPTPIEKALMDVTIAEYHGAKRPNAHGVNIVFYDLPEALKYSVYSFDYVNYNSATGTGSHSSFINTYNWDEMMTKYFLFAYPTMLQ